MHGGISHRLTSIEAINQIDRNMEPPDDSLLADLLWADPATSKEAPTMEYESNDRRGISVVFGRKPLKKLLKKSNLRAVVRAHEMKKEGYKFHTWDGAAAFPPVITIFSAPDYSNSNNDAAVLISDGDGVDIRTFSVRKDKPFRLPDDQDAFSIFQPRLQGLVLDAVYNILKFTLGSNSRALRTALSTTISTDEEYLQKVIAASHEGQEETKENITAAASSLKPRVQKENPTMDELLAGYEEDFGLDDHPDFDSDKGATIASEVNLLKQVSEQHMNLALTTEASLSRPESIDQHMDLEKCERADVKLDKQKEREIASLDKSDS